MEIIARLRDLSKRIEQNIIGQLLFAVKKIATIANIISEDDFSNPRAKQAFKIIKECVEKDQDINARMDETDLTFSEFIETEFKDIRVLAKELKRISSAVKLNLVLMKWNGRIDNRNLESSSISIFQELAGIGGRDQEETGIKEIIREYEKEQELYADKYKNGQMLLGMSCGFGAIDNIIDGIRPGHFWIIGGYNNTGKTFFALNIVLNVLLQGKRVVVYSMEMSKKDIAGRLMGLLAEMNSHKILKGILTDGEMQKQIEAKAKLYEANLTIHQNLDDYEEIKMSMYEENMKSPVDLFVIDYMQLLKSQNLTEYQLMTQSSSEFQSLGRKTGIPIIALSQISNETAKNPNQSVGGYKGSGGIEASSDIAIKLVQIEDLKTIQEKQQNRVPINIDCIVTKNRHGIKGAFPMSFEGYTGHFYNGHEQKIV